MSGDWLPAQPAADAEQPLLPLAFHEHVELIRSSRAVGAFARRRAGQIVNKGHTLESDLSKAPGAIAREALWRLTAFLEIVGPQRMDLPPGRREQCMKYVEGAGASLIALWDRLQQPVRGTGDADDLQPPQERQ
jgi:hypothetical protein